MDKTIRTPFQGIKNVIRFNWHFYALALVFVFIALASTLLISEAYSKYAYLIAGIIGITTSFSLLATYYIYDCSNVYSLDYLEELNITSKDKLVNIHSGFDEFSFTIAQKFNPQIFEVFDFYNREKHTEVSIERARKVSDVFPNTKTITTSTLPLATQSVNYIFVLFSAHEIRNTEERIVFFQEMEKILQQNGKVIVVEHLRDFNNFMAYTIGFFHFFSKSEWKKTFNASYLSIQKETKITPFVSVFILQKNGITS
ncbi:methyltransferase [Flavobacterium sp.]|uniref:methyltransferase n=1 Tax=Flavobacterium sp. TaxID=239 RepID=UPI00261550B6|nr:methyltransferase [Flavobacterium sp.]